MCKVKNMQPFEKVRGTSNTMIKNNTKKTTEQVKVAFLVISKFGQI